MKPAPDHAGNGWRRWGTAALVALGLAAVWGAGGLQPRLLAARGAARLNQAEPLENAPPLVGFTTVALGGFRGLLVDFLWMRAAELQQNGRYFELVQLADWITKLQPRFAAIWSYHAWNLAYNVSVLMSDPADRWRWVEHGIRLLRDEGLRYNPGSAKLYHELAWLFRHKMGDDLDQAHWYYKRVWARQMTDALGGGRPDFTALRAAARGEGHPELRARAQRLSREYRLDPVRMADVDDRYGPLDWRLPQTHAIYWAQQGLPFARARFDRQQLERMTFHALAASYFRGRLVGDPAGDGPLLLAPEPALRTRVAAAYEEGLRSFPDDQSYRTAHRNFLLEAVMISYTYNRRAEAQAIFDELRTRYPGPDTSGSLEDLIAQIWSQNAAEMNREQAVATVEGALFQSVFWQLLGDAGQSAGFGQLAQLVWDRYMADRRDKAEFAERTGLPPLDTLRAQAAQRAAEALREAQAAGGAAYAPR